MKTLAIIPALLLGATSVSAGGVDPSYGQVPVSINRSGAASIRSCQQKVGGRFNSVCYNQTTTSSVGALTRVTERVVRVNCSAPRVASTTRGAVANEFCPQVRANTLSPAPFLL